jgi:hypothetical protein
MKHNPNFKENNMFHTIKRLAVASVIALTLAGPAVAQEGRYGNDRQQGHSGQQQRRHARHNWGWYRNRDGRWVQRHCYFVNRYGQRVWTDCYNYYPDPYSPPPGFRIQIRIPF